MCLIYNHPETERLKAENKPLVLYKVYFKPKSTEDGIKSLCSPFCFRMRGGRITSAGEYKPQITGKFGYDCDWFSMGSLPHHDDKAMSITGFHCFVSKNDAASYAKALSLSGVNVDYTTHVVEVVSATANVIAAGATPWTVKANPKQFPTVVVDLISISEEEFQKAINQCA